MAWELLPVDYTDAVWSGLKKYNMIENTDGTVSFQDVTQYSQKEKSFFGAYQANKMDEALNTLMCAYFPAVNAGAHNAIYRGKNLGTSVTEEQYAAIAAGTFDDMYIGDYWVIDGVNWRIAAFDYYLNTGDTNCTTHHITIVPDTNLDTQQMNSSITTDGGYTGSAMYTANMATAKNKIKSAFGSAHILSHRQYLVNTVENGRPSAGAWVDSEIELMTEQNVYGGKVFAPTSDGSSVPTVHTVDKSQYPLFAHEPSRITNRANYWLRDIVSASAFAAVYGNGRAANFAAIGSNGVRPAFSIKS